jgi:hypothetical protein
MKAKWAAIVSVLAVAVVLTGSVAAEAKQVGSGTFQTPLGPIDWRWQVHVKRWAPGKVRIHQVIRADRAFDAQPDTHGDWVVVPTSAGRLDIQTGKIAAPVIQDQFYPYDAQALVAWPINLSGIVTLTDVRALKLHYVYTHTQPASPGTTDLVVNRPTSRHTVHDTRLKFWLVGANGGGNGAVYDLQTVHGKVRICARGRCRLYWKLIYKWPPWSRIAPLGRLSPVR